MKLGRYDGGTEIEAFIRRFEVCARRNSWDDSEKLDQLMCSLAAPADQLLWDFESASVMTWSDLVQRLRSRYGSADQNALYQTQLSTRRQRDGEDLNQLVQDIRRLMTLAYPGCTSEYGEQIAIRAFLDAVKDKSLALKVREKEPTTLDQAFKQALRLDGYRRASEETSDLVDRRPGRIKAVKEPEASVDTMRQMLRQELEPQKRRMAEFERALVALQQRRTTEAVGNREKNEEQTELSGMRPGMPNRLPRNRGFGLQERRPGRCYECNQFGHYARECRRRQEDPQGVTDGTPAEPGRVRYVEGNSYAYLPVTVHGRSTAALLDSGSEMSLAPASLVRPRDVKGSAQLLRAANGTEIRVLGETQLRCRAGDLTFIVPCLVTEQLSELIFGLEWLDSQQATWRFGERTIQIQGRTFQLQHQPRSGICRRVVVAHDTNVPALSEKDVEIFAVLPNLKVNPVGWATSPQVLESGVVVASTLLPERAMNMTVRMLNPTGSDILVKRGVKCAAEEVTVEPNHQDTEQEGRCAVIREAMDESDGKDDATAEKVLAPLWQEVDVEVSENVRASLRTLILLNREAFSLHEGDMGYTALIQHEIDTGKERPVRQPLRRQPMTLLPVIDEQVEQMLQQQIIEPSRSAWASNVVMVRKKDGTARFCVDYRAVNAKTRKDAYPLPLISESLDTLGGGCWFSTFDLRARYHQLAVHPRDKEKTAFITRRGLFHFRTLPFGLCNSPASFSRMMNLALTGLNYEVCLVYLDDIIVFAPDLRTHLERLRQILCRLREVGLKLKPTKCKLLRRQVLFLGHVISANGVATDPEKVQAVRSWPTPRTLRELRAFVGLCSYYRRFIPDFAAIARPLHGLTKKNVRFQWTDDCEAAFQKMKAKMMEAPVLAMPSDHGKFILDTDASGEAIGCVLSQVQDGVERVVCYGSRTCSNAEKNYDVTRRELLAIVYFLKSFRQYLLGRPFLLRTDHSALQWLRRTPLPIGQQARWLAIIEEFQFEIQHRAGTAHTNADAMSRRPHRVDTIQELRTAERVRMDVPVAWDRDSIKNEQAADKDFKWVMDRKAVAGSAPSFDEVRPLSSVVKTLVSQWPQIRLADGLLVRDWLPSDGFQPVRTQQ